jgi:multisubunit Na+/H+ antiporter MnhE subunit
MSRLVLSVVVLTVVYALALSSFDPLDLAVGAVVAIVLLSLFRPVTIGHHAAQLPALPARLVAFIPFALHVFLEAVVGTWRVSLISLGLRPHTDAAIIAVPIQARSHRGIAVTALVTTLEPGSYFIGVDWDRRVMLFHFLEGRDPEDIRRRLAHSYERYQRAVFP